MMTELEKYYNKFNEEKRLGSRHGQVEFTTSMKYIHEYLPAPHISDIYHRSEPILNLLAIIVTSRLFMFINKFTCYVGYKLFGESVVVLIPPIGFKKNKLKTLNKEFKKEVKAKKLNIDKLRES